MSPTTTFRRLALPATACALLLGACGSDTDGAGGVPSLSGADGADAASVTTTTIDAEEAAQKFVACLRERGLEVADPEVGSDGNVDMRSIFERAGIDPGNEEMRTAMDSCRDELGNAGFGPSEEDREERRQAMLAFTSCLRAEGLEVGDLTFDGPGGRPGGDGGQGGLPGRDGSDTDDSAATDGSSGTDDATIDGSAPSPPQRRDGPMSEEDRNQMLAERLELDPDDPAVTAAFSACSDELSAMAPGGPGGPGGTTTTEG